MIPMTFKYHKNIVTTEFITLCHAVCLHKTYSCATTARQA